MWGQDLRETAGALREEMGRLEAEKLRAEEGLAAAQADKHAVRRSLTCSLVVLICFLVLFLSLFSARASSLALSWAPCTCSLSLPLALPLSPVSLLSLSHTQHAHSVGSTVLMEAEERGQAEQGQVMAERMREAVEKQRVCLPPF